MAAKARNRVRNVSSGTIPPICDREVRKTIPVKVAYNDVDGLMPWHRHNNCRWRVKRAIAVAEQDRDVILNIIGNGQIEDAIAVEIPHRD